MATGSTVDSIIENTLPMLDDFINGVAGLRDDKNATTEEREAVLAELNDLSVIIADELATGRNLMGEIAADWETKLNDMTDKLEKGLSVLSDLSWEAE